VGSTDCGGWDCWECQAPGTPILHRVRTPRVIFASGSPADFDGLGVTFCGAYSSRALHRFIIGTDRSPDWFRLLSYCLGRTGRHRRTDQNRSVPNLIPTYTYNCLSPQATDCQISEWLLQRSLILSCRIHPAAEAAGILLELYNRAAGALIAFSAVATTYNRATGTSAVCPVDPSATVYK
jgi:hypothetical protein